MGFVTLGAFVAILVPIGTLGREQGMQGAVLQMVSHGLITGALFLLVGVIYERTHDRAIARMGGLSAPVPVFAATLGFFVLASAGLPGLSGFVGEFLVLTGSYAYQPIVAGLAALVMILVAGYLLWMFQRVVFGELSDFLRGLGRGLTDMAPVEVLTLAPLGALVVVFGVFPGLLLGLFDTSVAEILAAVGPVANLVAGR
jgi:NADH-quinone oxidoreductase subunit M